MSLWIVGMLLCCSAISEAQHCQLFDQMTCVCGQGSLNCETFTNLIELRYLDPSNDSAIRQYKNINFYLNMSQCLVSSRFFQPLNHLIHMPAWNSDDIVTVTISFARFENLVLEPMAFDGLFDNLPQNATKLSLEFYSTIPATVYPDTFKNLYVGSLIIYGSNIQSNESGLSFQSLFNHSSVSRVLRLEGITLPGNWDGSPFQGYVDRLQFVKQVNTISSSEFPPYPVNFYAISAHNPRSIDGQSFRDYRNLRGLAIHGGNIELTQAKLNGLNYLEELDLNVEQIDNSTLQPVSLTVKTLVLGNKLKHISPDNLEAMEPSIRMLDIRTVDFNQLSYPSRCGITSLVHNKLNSLDVFVDRRGCECHQLYVILIKGMQSLCDDPNYMDKCAQYAHCQMVRDYFRSLPSRASTEWSSEAGQGSFKHFRHQAAEGKPSKGNKDVPAIIVKVDQDMVVLPSASNGPVETDWIGDMQGTSDANHTIGFIAGSDVMGSVKHRPFGTSSHMQWIPIVIVCLVLIIALAVALLVWHLNFKRRRRGNFKPVPRDAAL